jgi:WD40 repeat protein
LKEGDAEVLFTLSGHTSVVQDLATDRAGKLLASAGEDGLVRLWDLASRMEKGQRPGMRSVALDGRGERLVTVQQERQAVLWATGSPPSPAQHTWHQGGVHAVLFSPPDPRAPAGPQLVVSGGDEAIRWHDPRTGKEEKKAKATRAPVISLACRPDGKMVAAALGKREGAEIRDRELRCWDLESGAEKQLEGHSRGVVCLAYSRDGRLLASGGLDGTVILWDGMTLERVGELNDHRGGVCGVAFSSDGRALFTTAQDNKLRIWDVETRALRLAVGAPGPPRNLLGLAVSPRGDLVAAGGHNGAIVVWKAETGEEVGVLRGHNGAVHTLAFTPSGKRLASGSADGTVRVWDPERGWELLTLTQHKRVVTSLAFSADGRWLASGSKDQTVALFEAP